MSEVSELQLDQRAWEFINSPVKLLIDGNDVESVDGQTFSTIDPSNGRELVQVAKASPTDVDIAVESARRAFDSGVWRFAKPSERARVLLRFADLLEEHAKTLAQLDTLDNGMPLSDARGAAPRGAEHFRYYAGWATKIHGDTIPVSAPGSFLNYTKREPVGVVGAIIAWNTPIDNAVWKLAAPLAAGCSIILKPAEQTPLSAVYLGRLLLEAGLPGGMVNVLPGFGEAGAHLAAHNRVDKVAFTGSTEVGRKIVQASAGNLKRLSLELGGKSPAIVFADADLESTVPGVFTGLFHNAGQICCAGSRVLLERKAKESFLEALVAHAQELNVGPGTEPETEMGPVVSDEQLRRVLDYIELGQQEGGQLLTGGSRLGGRLENGYFVSPTIFSDVEPDMKIAQEEIFGPVLAVADFEDQEDLLKVANQTVYGLAASVWTKDINKALAAVDALRAGTVWVNCHNMLDAASPFGGMKESGYGRELGHEVLDGYLDTKSVWFNYG